jgi:GT2 family glycosyltransferase
MADCQLLIMDADPTIFDTPHHRALELLALRALSTGRAKAAFEFADRRCRVAPSPNAHCFLLRAEASYRMGEIAEAISDLELALEISPQDILVNRRMLAWADGPRQLVAAAAVLARDRDNDALRTALALLHKLGRRAFASVAVLDDVIQGWAAWSHGGPVQLSLANSATKVTLVLEADRRHPLSGPDMRAVEINVPRPKSQEAQSISLAAAGETFFSIWVPANQMPPARPSSAGADSASRRITVIVPVYSGYETTKTCIESLLDASRPNARSRILIVDDATPDERIRRYLASASQTPGTGLLTNPTNMGFVGAVNRALAQVRDGDVVLLNSDTVVPPRFLERLAAAANASPDIGTVTPLSNNGEFMSFPTPNAVNRLGGPEEVIAIDNIAARVNRGTIVDLPTGIGFCLYITRKCLDRLGGLSERFHRGYLEDVDFCLRARELGMRAVCATDVYVGHAGSRSFLDEKKSLVARNFKVLETSFARYAPECLAFVDIDPLRGARAAIEQEMLPRQSPILLVTGNGVLAEVARERAQHLVSRRSSVLICEIRRGKTGPEMALSDSLGEAPQSIKFNLSAASERDRLFAFIRRTKASRIEFIDPASVPGDLAQALCGLGLPYDFFIADASLLGAQAEPSALPTRLRPGVLGQLPDRGAPGDLSPSQTTWTRLLKGANHILVPCERAEHFARRMLSGKDSAKLKRAPLYDKAPQISPMEGADRLGVVPSRTSAYELRLMREIALFMKRAHPRTSIVVLGETLDDTGLMRYGNVFVSGPVGVADLARLIRQYRLNRVLAGFGQPLFGHPITETAMNCGLPAAYIDWSPGDCMVRRGDLAIDASLSCRDIATLLGGWIAE